jgi:hypothetical protein
MNTRTLDTTAASATSFPRRLIFDCISNAETCLPLHLESVNCGRPHFGRVIEDVEREMGAEPRTSVWDDGFRCRPMGEIRFLAITALPSNNRITPGKRHPTETGREVVGPRPAVPGEGSKASSPRRRLERSLTADASRACPSALIEER